MAEITKRIGLSLGADLCWPLCFEEIVKRLDLRLPIAGDSVRFEVERVTIEPFDLRQPVRYDVVLDRLTHWYNPSREWIKKGILLDDLYVLNNPWSIQSMEKATTYCAMIRLGLPVPETWLLPPKEYEPTPDLQPTLERYAKLFDLGDVGRALGYPLFLKPYDGGAWVAVDKVEDEAALRRTYDESGKRVMHVQQAILPFDLFVRSVGLGPQVRTIRYNPSAPLHARYEVAFNFLSGDEAALLRDMTLTINSFFGWDFNSCETLRKEGAFYPIDFANACPDSQVTSLHYHFPWLVKAQVRWSLFCAATGRKMRKCVDWEPYFAIADREDLSWREKLQAYAAIADQRFDRLRFQEFCDTHLAHLDEVAWEFFGTDTALEAVRSKVEALFPEHEVEEFTEHFWGLIQFWRRTEADRLGIGEEAEPPTLAPAAPAGPADPPAKGQETPAEVIHVGAPESPPETETEEPAEIQVAAEPDAPAELETETEEPAEMQVAAEPDTPAELGPETEEPAEMQVAAGPEALAELEPEAAEPAELEVSTELEAEAPGDLEPEEPAEPAVEAGAEPAVETPAEPAVEAGAEPAVETPAEVEAAERQPETEDEGGEGEAAPKLVTVALQPRTGSLALSPRPIPSITPLEGSPAGGGVSFNLYDLPEVPFSDLKALSVFAADSDSGTLNLLLFVAGRRRPFRAEAPHIHFREFPIDSQPTLLPHLREFVFYLLREIPHVTVDVATYHFLQGEPPQVVEGEGTALATAFVEALEEDAGGVGA